MKKVIAVLALVLAVGAALFFLNRPPAPFDPAELTPAETVESCPSAELSLEIDGHSLELTFQNNSDSWLASGASVDRNNDFSSTAAWMYFWTANGIRFPGRHRYRRCGPGARTWRFRLRCLLFAGYDLPDMISCPTASTGSIRLLGL